MIGYKATDLDGKCRGFQFEVGKTYKKDTKKEDLECCTDKVFHFCRELHSVWNYYNKGNSRLFEVIAGDYVRNEDKYGTNEITLIREIKGDELKELLNSGNRNSGDWNSGYCNSGNRNSGNCNSGDWNSGNWNSGNWNSGNRNSGYCNSGNCNSGNWNSGNWNSGNRNSGYFNIDTPLVRIFGKDTDLKPDDIKFPNWLYFDLTVWVSHDTATEEEKEEHKQEITTCGGFLKTLNYKEAFTLAYNKATDDEKRQLFELPNFDCDIFTEISGAKCKKDYKRLMY